METPYQYEQGVQKELRQMYINQVYGHIRYKYPVRRIICGGCGKEFFYADFFQKVLLLQLPANRFDETQSGKSIETTGKPRLRLLWKNLHTHTFRRQIMQQHLSAESTPQKGKGASRWFGQSLSGPEQFVTDAVGALFELLPKP